MADLSPDKEMLQEVIKKSSEAGPEAVSWLPEACRIGLRRDCRLMMQLRTVCHY